MASVNYSLDSTTQQHKEWIFCIENTFPKLKYKNRIRVQSILLNDWKYDLVIFIEEAIWLITKCDIWYCLNSEGFAYTLDKYDNFWEKF